MRDCPLLLVLALALATRSQFKAGYENETVKPISNWRYGAGWRSKNRRYAFIQDA
jgi:hypothetical protein